LAEARRCAGRRRHARFGLDESRGGDDQQALRAALARIALELASEWPRYRDLDGTLAGAKKRHENVSEAWAWLWSYEVARRYVFDLFGDALLAAISILVEHTADALNGLLGTMSFWARLLGRPIRPSTVACLVTARRAPRT
jgi:hypothetical protein